MYNLLLGQNKILLLTTYTDVISTSHEIFPQFISIYILTGKDYYLVVVFLLMTMPTCNIDINGSRDKSLMF